MARGSKEGFVCSCLETSEVVRFKLRGTACEPYFGHLGSSSATCRLCARVTSHDQQVPARGKMVSSLCCRFALNKMLMEVVVMSRVSTSPSTT